MVLEYAILVVVVSAVAVSLYYSWVTGISPIPSSRISRKKILDLLPEKLEGRILELGAGWGTLAFPLAAAFPEAEVLAYELSPVPWMFMCVRHKLFSRRNLDIQRRDFLREQLGPTSAVICYLHSEALEKLRPKLEREAAPGTIVVSNTFEVPGWTPEAVYRLDDSFCPNVYVYRVPERGGE